MFARAAGGQAETETGSQTKRQSFADDAERETPDWA